MIALQTIWWFLVLIGIMILLHELGHYAVARLFDVKVEAFSFGFGPRLFGWKRGETDFRFCAFLLGGYVKMAGEQPGEEGANDPRAFPSKPRWQRMLIVFAGPAVNVVLAVALLTGLFMWEYPKVPNPVSPRIGYLAADGAAAKAGLKIGDRIVSIDGQQNPDWESIFFKEVTSANQPLNLYVERDGQQMNFTVTPKFLESQGAGSAGWAPESEVQIGGFCCGVDVAKDAGLLEGDTIVSLNGTNVMSASHFIDLVAANKGQPATIVYRRNGQEQTAQFTPVWSKYDGVEQWRVGAQLRTPVEVVQLPFGDAIRQSVQENVKTAGSIFVFLKGVVQQRMSPKAISGPIGIARMSGEAARAGATTYIALMAAVSLNLAIVNLLPIPLLDGGTILMLGVEMLMRRDLDLRVKEAVVKFGLVFLMVVIVFVIYNDIAKMIPGG